MSSPKNILGQENTSGPHYEFEVGNLELFQKKLEEAQDKGVFSSDTILLL